MIFEYDYLHQQTKLIAKMVCVARTPRDLSLTLLYPAHLVQCRQANMNSCDVIVVEGTSDF